MAEDPSKGCYLRPSVVTLRRQAPQDLIQSYKVKAIALRNTQEEDIKQEVECVIVAEYDLVD